MKRILTILCVLLPITSIGQGWYRNYEKYWWYRYRLVNDFMKVGPDYGESIPAYTRQRGTPETGGRNGFLLWGDGTQALGHYLAATALEYRILYANGWGTNRTSYENYNAQLAFERLDGDAESYCKDIHGTYPNMPTFSQKNGFFIRDDVSQKLFDKDSTHFNRPGITNLNHVGGLNQNHVADNQYGYSRINDFDYRGVLSDYMIRGGMSNSLWQYDYNFHWFKYWYTHFSSPPAPSVTGYPPQYPTEENQDQLSEMFVGLGLSQKYMGSFNGINLSNKAADNILRTEAYAGSSPTPWVIKNPLTTHCVYGIETDQYFWANGCLVSGAVMLQAAPAAAKLQGCYVAQTLQHFH